MKRECVRSADLLAAMTSGPVSQLSDDELLKHAETCESCREMVTVVSALRAERDRLRRNSTVPSAGLVWWRAQLRARQQAALRAAAPVTAVHAAAVVAAVVLAVALVSVLIRSLGTASLAGWVPAIPSWTEAPRSLASEFPFLGYSLMAGATTWLVLGPVALYFAFRRD
jgi:hypothetical protein